MDQDPNQPHPLYSGQHPPHSESPPSWGQQPFPHDRHPPVRSRMRRAATVLLLLIPAGVLVRSLFFSNVVTTLSDDGPGSLRWDIAWAIPGSTITFDPNLRGTILLTSSDLRIEKNLTIRGPGADKLSISSGNSGHIVHVFLASVTISGLSFKDSKTRGSFIVNDIGGTTLTLSNSIISDNTGASGGILNSGTLTLTNSTVSGNTASGPNGGGGGILNDIGGTLTLSNSTVSGNTATGDGGGILNDGTLTLSNSTVSDNMATSDGGGIFKFGGTLTLSNSTVSGNRATGNGGGIAISKREIFGSGTLTAQVMLLYGTVYGNTANVGGGIWIGKMIIHWIGNLQQVVAMGASIVAGNSAHAGPDVAGQLASLGYNLVGDRSGAIILGSPKIQSTDKLGVSSTGLKIDPVLQDNGRSAQPHTRTHALLPGVRLSISSRLMSV